jgi:RNA polymerase sigma-70 factor (ECF subfamily)
LLDSEERGDVEARARALADAGEHDRVTTLALQNYGPEIFGYLVAIARSETDADEAFAMFSEDLWRGLPAFRWESSLRTWLYTLARHALARLRRDPHRRPERRIRVSQSPDVQAMAEQVRTNTLPYLRSEVKDRVARLRAQMDTDDQTLFILRLDRKMSWEEIARIMVDEGDGPPDKAAVARLRKRFERAKARLRELVDQGE